MQAHVLDKHTRRHVYKHPPTLYESAIVPPFCLFSPSSVSHRSTTRTNYFQRQFSPLTFLLSLLYVIPSVRISMENETGVWACSSPSLHPFIFTLYPYRQKDILALQLWKRHGGLSLDRMIMIIILILMKNKWFLFRWTLPELRVNLLLLIFFLFGTNTFKR